MLTNADIATALERIGQLMDLRGEPIFRTRAYKSAADAIRQWPASVGTLALAGQAKSIPGIGPALNEKIVELATSGRSAYLEELEAGFPPGIFELMSVPGLGGKTALRLGLELGIHSIADLEDAARANRIRVLTGMGEKRELAILKSIESLRRKDERHPIADALPVAEMTLRLLQETGLARQLHIAGSARRFEETIGDIDLIATSERPSELTSAFVAMPFVASIVGYGPAKATIIAQTGIQVDLKVVEPDDYGSLLQHFTGSRSHNIRLREYAQRKGLKVSEYGIVDEKTGLTEHFATEEALYARLGMAYILPELRQGLDEIERALHGPLPQLIRRADLLGDLHAHTDESDGKATLQQMVGAAKQAGLRYLTICDHSVGRAVARGLTPERLVEQGALIKQVNSEQTDGFRVLAGSEVDIRSDGRLDFPDEVLASLDFVVASIHSAMQQDRDAMTRRVLRAIENPHVAAIGHLTARIIGRRDPVALDVDAVLSAAARTGTALEINGSLERLDLSSAHVRQARDAGVTLTITTDAHDEHSFTNLDYGVSLARRAWTEAADVLNTRDVDAVLAFRQAKQRNASLP